MQIENGYPDFSFNVGFQKDGEPGNISIYPEISPTTVQGITPTGRCLHPVVQSVCFH